MPKLSDKFSEFGLSKEKTVSATGPDTSTVLGRREKVLQNIDLQLGYFANVKKGKKASSEKTVDGKPAKQPRLWWKKAADNKYVVHFVYGVQTIPVYTNEEKPEDGQMEFGPVSFHKIPEVLKAFKEYTETGEFDNCLKVAKDNYRS